MTNKIEEDIKYLKMKLIWVEHIVKNEADKNMTLQLASEITEISNRIISKLQEYKRKISSLRQDIDILKKAVRNERKKKKTLESVESES